MKRNNKSSGGNNTIQVNKEIYDKEDFLRRMEASYENVKEIRFSSTSSISQAMENTHQSVSTSLAESSVRTDASSKQVQKYKTLLTDMKKTLQNQSKLQILSDFDNISNFFEQNYREVQRELEKME